MNILREWDRLPDFMRIKEILPYYRVVKKKKRSLLWKRIFDVIISLFLILVLLPVMVGIAIWIKVDSKGSIFFRQARVTQYGKEFNIFKFRTMVENAEQMGTQITTQEDNRITNVGKILRKIRLDELPQLFNVILGDMSFVGTRPEVPKYVKFYTAEMNATLLLPAGITSEASIKYKDEEQMLTHTNNPDVVYISEVLPQKMRYNLKAIQEFGFWNDIKTMIKTVIEVGK